MAMGAGGAGGGGRGRRRGRRRATLSEINVTPLVDVMLVLLIIFMISAPLLTAGVEVELPKTEAASMQDTSEPLTVSVQKDGAIFVQEDRASYEELAPRLKAMTGGDAERPIFVRADAAAPYEAVARVMAKLSISGFTKINLITDTGGGSTPVTASADGAASAPAEAPAP